MQCDTPTQTHTHTHVLRGHADGRTPILGCTGFLYSSSRRDNLLLNSLLGGLEPESFLDPAGGSHYLFCQTTLCRAHWTHQRSPCHVADSPLQVFRDCDDDDGDGGGGGGGGHSDDASGLHCSATHIKCQ